MNKKSAAVGNVWNRGLSMDDCYGERRRMFNAIKRCFQSEKHRLWDYGGFDGIICLVIDKKIKQTTNVAKTVVLSNLSWVIRKDRIRNGYITDRWDKVSIANK